MQGRRDLVATLQRQLAAEVGEWRGIGSAAAVAWEKVAVAGQRTSVERLCALGFDTGHKASCPVSRDVWPGIMLVMLRA